MKHLQWLPGMCFFSLRMEAIRRSRVFRCVCIPEMTVKKPGAQTVKS
jgi:hypothetical protein